MGQKVYDSKAWQLLRQAYYDSQHGICEWCGSPGDIVDHIEPITSENVNDIWITLNWENLQLLCLSCHNKKTFRKHFAIREGFGFDENGDLIVSKT
ncbi:HNH endonuclease [Bacillus sp. Sa1BUA2]|uniref:HNH endonuclease n=1 Tax=Bacillus norwichensis TaxID=2762217 RepID=A0ABR8VM42_9BACI|nr:HNH endonuclease [Bacillus norwichensis]